MLSLLGGVLGVGASLLGRNSQRRAAAEANKAQQAAMQQALDVQKSMWQQNIQLNKPYLEAGNAGLSHLRGLSGIDGNDAQQAELDNITNGAEYKTNMFESERAMLQNGSATGGLRGGNIQGGLQRNANVQLNNLVNQQYDRYSGLAGMGQAATSQAIGLNGQYGNNVANLNIGQGEANANERLAIGEANTGLYSNMASMGGSYLNGRSIGGNNAIGLNGKKL